jgi:manganese/iron transport system permease protein/iron/zinc/copper transport system permease protein
MIPEWWTFFAHPLTEPFFQKALLGGGMVGLVCGVVGTLVILRRMAFLGDALSHTMLAGVAGGYLVMKLAFGVEAHTPAMLIGSVIAAIITVGMIGFVSRVSRIKEDSAIGIMYCGIFSAGVVLTSLFSNYIHIDLMHFIMGDVLGVSNTDLWATAIVAAIVLSVILLFFRHFQIASFDPIMAASIGLPVVLIDYALTTCVSMVVVTGVGMVGVILVIGLLITPAATAYLLTDRLERMMVLAAFFGVSSVVGGLYLAVGIDSAGGGAIILFSTFQFLTALVFAPRYGLLADWLRRRNMIPQEQLEDILKQLYHAPAAGLDRAALKRQLSSVASVTGRALERLTSDGHIEGPSGMLRLTGPGRERAEQVVRAHRIWETYLEQTGVPMDDVHKLAEQLEHLDRRDSVEYLDHRLGHPLTDPHGSEIPRPRQMMVSTMAPGCHANVTALVNGAGRSTGLATSERIQLTDRADDAERFTITRADGSELVLTHAQADAVQVQNVEP